MKRLEEIALGTFLSEFPEDKSFDDIVLDLNAAAEGWELPDGIVLLEKFEEWHLGAIADMIQELKSDIYNAIRPAKTAAQMYYTRDKEDIDDYTSDDLLNLGGVLSDHVNLL